jgi:ribokinase
MIMFDIITIGSATRDGFFQGIDFKVCKNNKFVTSKGLCLALGSKISVPEVIFTTGGGATNTAVTFARQGLKTVAIFRVGKDVSGETILRELKEEGVNINFAQIDYAMPTAYSVIFLIKSGERTILSYKGAAEKLTLWEIPLSQVKTKWLLLGSLGKEKNILKNLILWAKEKKIHLAINPGWRELGWLKKNKKWLNNFEIFVVNQEEAAYFTGISFKREKLIFQKLDHWIKGIVVMTKGKNGVSVSNGKYLFQARTFDKKISQKPKDLTGAGDAFTSGFVSVFVRRKKFDEKTIEEAIKVGSINASSVIKYIGAKKGVITLKEIKRLINKELQIKKVKL